MKGPDPRECIRMTDLAGDHSTQHTSSEADVLAGILSWSQGCPAWQRDALRRLCIKGKLDAADLDELTDLCRKKGNGSICLSQDHLPNPKAASEMIKLKAIRSAENINALKPDQHLSFDQKGLTVIYGDNGSGKSGYARILKKACRARTSQKENRISPNIYAQENILQQVIIDFNANRQSKRENWNTEHPCNPLLSSISVFDSSTANVHVDNSNDIAYTPFPMRMLEQLAEVCQEVKKRIRAEIDELNQETPKIITNPQCHSGTKVDKLISGIKKTTKDQDVRDLASLDANEKVQLETLKTDLRIEPSKAIRKVDALKRKLDSLITQFEALHKAVDDKQLNHLKELHQTYQTAKAAATVAADNMFANDPLPDIGSETWRELWETARNYSEENAYPNTPFPFTGNSARCVLCQQELDEQAVDRFNRFENFIKNETKRKENEATAAYQAALNELINTDVPSKSLWEAVSLICDELNDNHLAKLIRRTVVIDKWRLRAVRIQHVFGRDVIFPVADTWPGKAIAERNDALLQRITALHAEETSEEHNQMCIMFKELQDREWLALVQDDVISEIDRQKKQAALNEILKDTTTNRITNKSSQIAEQLVTNMLRAKFSQEISQLGVSELAIELRKDRTSRGVPHFRVSLIQKPDATVGSILSEGEHRCVALAAFLAELATTESRSAIVFDDPVSSLDHKHREAVALRLSEEGQQRQIIVFTHDIAFLFLLDQACRDKRTHIGFRNIMRNHDYAGLVEKDLPVRVQSVERVIDGMEKQLNNEKCLYKNGQHNEWQIIVDSIQKRLRWTWERAVEEVVGPVFKRLSSKVETKGLAKLTVLTIDDCRKMRQAYGRCSKWLHSAADVLNLPPPKPEDIQNEITTLKEWIEDIKQRQEEINHNNLS